MAGGSKSVLTQRHYERLNEALQRIERTEQLIKDCDECGLPMAERRALNDQQRRIAEQLKRKFFPQMP